MTVRQLKDLCREKSLPVGGNKAEIVDRILNGDAQERNGGLLEDEESSDDGGSQGDPSGDDRNLIDLSISELKELCQQRRLPTSGRKRDMVKRLNAAEIWSLPAVGDVGSEIELAAPAVEDDDRSWEGRKAILKTFPLANLRGICHSRRLPAHGSHSEIVDRILVDEFPESLTALRRTEDDEEDDPEAAEALDRLLSARARASPAEQFVQAVEADEIDVDALEKLFRADQPPIGSIVTGEVKSIVDYGAFVQLHESAWSGMLHVSEICNTFVENIEDFLQPGEHVTCLVIPSFGDRLDRVSLSMKRLEAMREDGEIDPSDMKLADPAAQRITTTMQQKRDPLLLKMERLQVRIGAIEALMDHIGHGAELRAAQEESRIGMSMPAVPAQETLLGGLDRKEDDNGFNRYGEVAEAAQKEQSVLTSTLQDLGFDDGEDEEDDEDDEDDDDDDDDWD